MESVMPNFYVLDWDTKPLIVGHVEDKNAPLVANKFTRGHAFAPDRLPKDLRILIEMGPEGHYPDYFTLQQTPIASDRLVTALQAVANNIDVYPAPIVEGGKVFAGHSVLNIIGRVSCLDPARTDATYIDEEKEIIFRIKKLGINEIVAANFDLFRLHEFELVILVSERVRAALQGFSSLTLLPAQGWSDSVWF
jgi:hypothetical protein